MFRNLEHWEVMMLVGYQCAVLTVFFYLVASLLGMAVLGSTEASEAIRVVDVLQNAFNHVATLFFFVSPGIIGAGKMLEPE